MGFLNDGTKQWHQAGVQVVRLFYFMFSLLVYFVFLRYFSESDAGELPKSKTKRNEEREEKQPSNNQKERRSLSSTSTGGEAVLCD